MDTKCKTSNTYELKDILKPDEKCIKYGVESLYDYELLAVILRTGTTGISCDKLCKLLMDECCNGGGLSGLLYTAMPNLTKVKGIGRVKALQIICICELSRRIAKQNALKRLDFSNPKAIADYYMQDLRCLSKENLILVMLDTKCRLIRDTVISIGTVNSSLITPRELYAEALKHEAVSIVLVHNHPSGDATPSSADFAVTKRVCSAGNILGINLIDHIIIGDNTYTSLKEKELL